MTAQILEFPHSRVSTLESSHHIISLLKATLSKALTGEVQAIAIVWKDDKGNVHEELWPRE